MKLNSLHFAIPLVCLGLFSTAEARDIVVPAGTLMTCTLDEPKFSSATVAVGDPFLCYPRNLQQFGQTVFPRGTYIVGHLEGDKEPGHFVGKGYLKLAFDRIGLPSADVPITAKVIAVAGFNVDREGKIIGHGHATRDTVEWMLPPLWPWKIVTLPARGPRPTLKGETRVTLRVMDDLIVPQTVTSGWHRFGEEPSSFKQPGSALVPRAALAGLNATGKAQTIDQSAPLLLTASAEFSPTREVTPDAGLRQSQNGASPTNVWAAGVTLFALTDGTVFPADQYWRDQDQLLYLSDGDRGTVTLKSIDWGTTTRLNAERNVRVTLRNAPAEN
jgi:hypothetical protein